MKCIGQKIKKLELCECQVLKLSPGIMNKFDYIKLQIKKIDNC